MGRINRWLGRHAKAVFGVAVVGWFAWVAGALWSGRGFRPGWIVTLFAILVAGSLLRGVVASMQRMQIREGRLPVRPKRELKKAYPALEPKDVDLVERGFRQFFLACARSDGRYVAMPSKAVDAYWHAFLIDTKGYADWCDRTLGRFLHHVPAERLGSDAQANDGLRRAWFFACKEEAIDPRKPSRLPLLFALDAKLGIEGGIVYSPRERPVGLAPQRDGGNAEISYGDDFSADGFAGDADGMGGSDGGGDGGDGGGDGGGGCGGGDYMAGPWLNVTDVPQAIQLAIGPVFLLTGIAGILNVMAGRLARIIDRGRRLTEGEIGLPASFSSQQQRELRAIDQRRRLASSAITACTLSALLVCTVIAALFLEVFIGFHLGTLIGILFMGSTLSLVVGLFYFLREVHLATRTIRIAVPSRLG